VASSFPINYPDEGIGLNKHILWVPVILLAAVLACTKEAPTAQPWNPSDQGTIKTACPADVLTSGGCSVTATPTTGWYVLPTRATDESILTPTPDPPRIVPTFRVDVSQYTVQQGDTLAIIANRYNVSYEVIAQANQLANPNSLEVGQNLIIPAPTPSGMAPDFKIIPDSELIYSPETIGFDVNGFIQSKAGFLATYTEQVDQEQLSGSDEIIRIAEDYSINPRLFLAVLEYTSGWVTNPNPSGTSQKFPLGYFDDRYSGLYKQLSFAASNLNRGFYLWQINAVPAWLLADGTRIPVANSINAGTAGVQQLMAALYSEADWEKAISADGLFSTYQNLFGYPFDFTLEPLTPANLVQPMLQLPFEANQTWNFTGGPHSGWGDGSAWAALDFAPPGVPQGCVISDSWVTASADGPVIRSDHGEVVQDLDGDGYLQTGWTVLYLHIDSRDRVNKGVVLKAVDKIGHPSCEGGTSNGTHVHLARRYNGMWISADGKIPFNLDGWISSGDGVEYDGFLTKEGVRIEAYNGQQDTNQINR
jgi:LasA protease